MLPALTVGNSSRPPVRMDVSPVMPTQPVALLARTNGDLHLAARAGPQRALPDRTE